MTMEQFSRIVKAQQENVAACENSRYPLTDSDKNHIALLVYKIYGKIFEMEAQKCER